ncbi:Ger(x)C family spore germination protein [Syntrophomonas palmitatica]|uniref:Ger(x)C family spore germination protein n=1 Tax=Syntrophomonas palmitatica TaxID=402877 RepID=UPI0006D168FA|nr:Ger(x)C family spore germination protein [Syntrophomonas palmitatica]
MKKHLLIFMFLCLLGSAGCQAREVNDTVVPTALGFELENDNQLKLSMQLAQPKPSQQGGSSQGQKPFIVLSGLGRTATEASRQISLNNPRFRLLSQASLYLMGEKLARHDLSVCADVLSRSPDIRESAIIMVTNGSTPEEILNASVPMEPYSGTALPKMIRIQERLLGVYQPVTLQEFLYRLSSPGIDVALPEVTVTENNGQPAPLLNGTAIFKGAKMAGELNERESRGYRWMKAGNIQGGMFMIPSPRHRNRHVALEILRSNAKVTPEIKDGSILIKIDVTGEGNFYEQNSSDQLLTSQGIKDMEKMADQVIAADIRAAISRAQESQSDIFGWGKLINDHYPESWRTMQKNWSDIFPTVESRVKVDFSIRRTYLFQKSFRVQ